MLPTQVSWPSPPTKREARVPANRRTKSQWLRFGECDYARWMRDTVRQWLCEMEASARCDAVSALQEGDDARFCQNFSELVVGEWLRRQGFSYSRHPRARNGKSPDFEVHVDGNPFYVEVVTSTGYSSVQKSSEQDVVYQEAMTRTDNFMIRLFDQLICRLKKVGPSKLVLNVEIEGTLRSDPKVKPVVNELAAWVCDGAPARRQWDDDDAPCERRFTHYLRGEHAWVTIEAKKDSDVELASPCLWGYGWSPATPQALGRFKPECVLKNAMERKLSIYGVEVPLIVVLCVPEIGSVRWTKDPELALDKLFKKDARKCENLCGVLVIGNTCPTQFSQVRTLWASSPSYRGPAAPEMFLSADGFFGESSWSEYCVKVCPPP